MPTRTCPHLSSSNCVELVYEVTSIAETASGSSDRSVLDLATTEGALLLTDDRDFGELVFRHGLRTSGVLYLRLEGMPGDERVRVIISLLRAQGDGLLGSFTVLTVRGARFRQLGL